MKVHHPHRSEPDRTRCGRVCTDATRTVADPDQVTCRRCQQLEPAPARRFGLIRYELEAGLIDAAGWLRDADRGTIQLARMLADQLDQCDLETGDMMAAARQLTAIHRALGLSPDGRAQLEVQGERERTTLDDLRDRSVLRAVDQ